MHWRICFLVILLIVAILPGCQPDTEVAVREVRLWPADVDWRVYDTKGHPICDINFKDDKMMCISMPVLTDKIASFFPGVKDTARRKWPSYHVRSPKLLTVEIGLVNGQTVKIYVKSGYWGFQDEVGGDRPINGDFETFMMALLYEPQFQESSEGHEEKDE